MRSLAAFPKIYLYLPPIDMRKQMAGLSVLVVEALGQDPFADCLYLFRNKRRDLIKCIYWDKTGFALWCKKLDQEKFPWPKKFTEEVIYLQAQQVAFLLDGIDIWKLKKHKNLEYTRLI